MKLSAWRKEIQKVLQICCISFIFFTSTGYTYFLFGCAVLVNYLIASHVYRSVWCPLESLFIIMDPLAERDQYN